MPFLALALLLAQQASTPLGPAAQVASVATPVHIAGLQLTYDVPAGLAMDPGLAAAAQQEPTAGGAPGVCVTSPLTAADPTPNFRLIVLVQIDFACRGQAATPEAIDAIVTSTLTEALHRFGEGAVTAPVRYKVGDFPAAFVRGSVKSEAFATTIHGGATCVLEDKGMMGCWEFLAKDRAAIDSLAAAPIHLNGHDALALVPASVAEQAR